MRVTFMPKTMSEYLNDSKTKPIFIEFWAPTCAICKTIEEDLNAFVKENLSKFDFVKIDSPENMALVEEFDVYNSPTFFVLKSGAVLQKFKGTEFNKVKELLGGM
jgi:thioredoxin-like negative regulator of GroEL